MRKFFVPSEVASSQEGSSSFPMPSLGLLVSIYCEESTLSVIKFCDKVGSTIN